MNALENIGLLRRDMERKGWVIDSFLFKYKGTEYIVLVKLYEPSERKPKYASVKLEFLKSAHITDSLEVPANRKELMIETKKLLIYFGIKPESNNTNILLEFSKYLGKCIPTAVLSKKNEAQTKAMVLSLCKSDSENPDKVYCNKVRRNPNRADGSPGKRSVYNDNVTRIRRPNLYEKLHTDPSLSFCYYDDPSRHKEDGEIIANWALANQVK